MTEPYATDRTALSTVDPYDDVTSDGHELDEPTRFLPPTKGVVRHGDE